MLTRVGVRVGVRVRVHVRVHVRVCIRACWMPHACYYLHVEPAIFYTYYHHDRQSKMHVYQILVSTVERAEMRMERPHVNARDSGQNRCAKVRYYSQSNADSLIIYLFIHSFTKFFTVRIYNSLCINCKLRPTISKKVNLQQY